MTTKRSARPRAVRALLELGGRATSREIAFRARLAPHEVAGELRHAAGAICVNRTWLILPTDPAYVVTMTESP